MAILITGGAGFIGSNFIHAWFGATDEPVVNLDRLTYAGNMQNLAGLPPRASHCFVHGDIGDRALVDGLLAEERQLNRYVDAISDLAGGEVLIAPSTSPQPLLLPPMLSGPEGQPLAEPLQPLLQRAAATVAARAAASSDMSVIQPLDTLSAASSDASVWDAADDVPVPNLPWLARHQGARGRRSRAGAISA
jgi:hypothetical protein